MKNLSFTPIFVLIFGTTLFLTLLSAGLSFWLAAQSNLSNQQIALFDCCTVTWHMGSVSIFGLLGGKTIDLFSASKD